MSPIVLNEGKTNRIAFVSYYKGEYSIHTLERKEPLHTAATSDFGAPGPIIDFQAPLQHTLVADNERKKKPFEKMFLEGRPPVNVGVTSSGDIFGGTQVSFGDVLGDKQFNFFAASISQYRTLSLSLRRTCRGGSSTRCRATRRRSSSTASSAACFYDPSLAPLISRDDASRDAHGARRQRLRHLSAQPLPPRRGLGRRGAAGRAVQRPGAAGSTSQQYQQQLYGQTVFRNGTLMPLGVAFVQETTVFREFGPLAGSTMRLAYDVAPKIGSIAVAPDASTATRATTCASARTGLLAHAHPRLQEHRRLPGLPCTSAATRRCAATTTCSSSGRTSSSPTPSCASR